MLHTFHKKVKNKFPKTIDVIFPSALRHFLTNNLRLNKKEENFFSYFKYSVIYKIFHRNELFYKAFKIKSKSAKQFINIYDPVFNEEILNTCIFKLETLGVSKNSYARIVIKHKTNASQIKNFNNRDSVVLIASMKLKSSFKLVEVITTKYTRMYNKKFIDENTLINGNYSMSIQAIDKLNNTFKSREHLFTVNNKLIQKPNKRYYCIHPYKTMLMREGGVMPCCNLKRNERFTYNPNYEGDFDPWNSEAMINFRKSFKESNAKYCYENCNLLTTKPVSFRTFLSYYTFFKQGDKSEALINEYQKRYNDYLSGKSILKFSPDRLGIMVGTVCNIDCVFCPIPFLKNRRSIFNNQMLLILQNHLKTARMITFTGGEPLVYIKELRRLEKFFNKSLIINIATNGIGCDNLINFATNTKALSLKISLNVATRDDYIYLHEKDLFDRVIRSIKNLKEQRPETIITLKFIIMKKTYNSILTFAKLCKKLKVDSCNYSELYIKVQSKIDPKQKITSSDPEYDLAIINLKLAKKFCEKNNIMFSFNGFDIRPDDIQLKENIIDDEEFFLKEVFSD